MKLLHLATFLSSSAILIGCAASGTPLLRTSDSDGEGRLITGCNNVSSKVRVDKYISNSYLTTWESAHVEGSAEGYKNAIKAAGPLKGGVLLQQFTDSVSGRSSAAKQIQTSPETVWREKTNSLSSSPSAFCRRYPAKFSKVARATAITVGNLAHRALLADEKLGVFETDFIERRHVAARWRDRYIIQLERDGADQTIIKVLRIVYIDRSGDTFNQGISVGQNEAWIMTSVADLLEKLE